MWEYVDVISLHVFLKSYLFYVCVILNILFCKKKETSKNLVTEHPHYLSPMWDDLCRNMGLTSLSLLWERMFSCSHSVFQFQGSVQKITEVLRTYKISFLMGDFAQQ